MLHGIGASEGIGIGTAVLVAEPDLDYSYVTPAGPEAEKARLATAEPTMQEGSTRRGSLAAKGMAPSVMKHRPMI